MLCPAALRTFKALSPGADRPENFNVEALCEHGQPALGVDTFRQLPRGCTFLRSVWFGTGPDLHYCSVSPLRLASAMPDLPALLLLTIFLLYSVWEALCCYFEKATPLTLGDASPCDKCGKEKEMEEQANQVRWQDTGV